MSYDILRISLSSSSSTDCKLVRFDALPCCSPNVRLTFDWCSCDLPSPPAAPPPPPPRLDRLPRLEFNGGGRKRDGSSNECIFVCFLTGVLDGDVFRLLENDLSIFALE